MESTLHLVLRLRGGGGAVYVMKNKKWNVSYDENSGNPDTITLQMVIDNIASREKNANKS